jgi:hypothetical protein
LYQAFNLFRFLEDYLNKINIQPLSLDELVESNPSRSLDSGPEMLSSTASQPITATTVTLQNSLLELRDKMNTSPFKPKEKSLDRVIDFPKDFNYTFGKPLGVTDESLLELGRTFRELVQLGQVCKDKWNRALMDKELFHVRKKWARLLNFFL